MNLRNSIYCALLVIVLGLDFFLRLMPSQTKKVIQSPDEIVTAPVNIDNKPVERVESFDIFGVSKSKVIEQAQSQNDNDSMKAAIEKSAINFSKYKAVLWAVTHVNGEPIIVLRYLDENNKMHSKTMRKNEEIVGFKFINLAKNTAVFGKDDKEYKLTLFRKDNDAK